MRDWKCQRWVCILMCGSTTLWFTGCALPAATVATSSPSICQFPLPDPVTSKAPLDVLARAFRIARSGAPIAITKTTTQNVRLQTSSVRVSEVAGALSALQTKQAKAVAAGAAPPQTVEAVLAARVPWLSGYPSTMVDPQASPEAVSAALDVIDLLSPKQASLAATRAADSRVAPAAAPAVVPSAALVAAAPASAATGTAATVAAMPTPAAQAPATQLGSMQATFSKEDHDKIQQTWQRFAGIQPFHVLTLLLMRQIEDALPAGQDVSNPDAVVELVRLFNISDFLATYFDAYFRSGQFVQVDVGTTAFADDAIAAIKKVTGAAALDEAQLRNALTSACATGNNASTCLSLGSLGSTGFVSLSGETVQFSGIKVAFDGGPGAGSFRPSITRPAVGEFGPQLARVLVEALADANGPHPAGAPNATACAAGTGSNAARLFHDEDSSSVQCLAKASDESSDWQRVNAIGNATEAVVTTGVGAAIRGGNVAALNNEAIASIVETVAGVASRKAVQQVMTVCAPLAGGLTPVGVGVTKYSGQ